MAVNREQVLQSAEKLLAKGKLDQALKEYLRVLEDNAKDISTLNKVGDLYVRMNRPADSIPFFTRIADFYSQDGFFLKAIAIFKKINKIDPAQLEVYDKLADLYHKQGLVQDARSQYQVLADHYQKNNRVADAIAVYKKMAAIDPADMRIQVRLADLYRSANQKDEAVMQYGLIGSMLLKRGAHDEAAQVFQKALELSPDDVESQKNLVRSLLAQNNTDAAMAVLKAAPRTAESLALFAEAQLEMGQRAEAVRTAEQALQLDADAEAPRVFLCRLRIQEQALGSRRRRDRPGRRRGGRPSRVRPGGRPPRADSLGRSAPRRDARETRARARGRGQSGGARARPRHARRSGGEAAGSGGGPRALPPRARGESFERPGRREAQGDRSAVGSRAAAAAGGDADRGGPRDGPRDCPGVPGVRDRPRGVGLDPRAAAQGAIDRVRARPRPNRRRSPGRRPSPRPRPCPSTTSRSRP